MKHWHKRVAKADGFGCSEPGCEWSAREDHVHALQPTGEVVDTIGPPPAQRKRQALVIRCTCGLTSLRALAG